MLLLAKQAGTDKFTEAGVPRNKGGTKGEQVSGRDPGRQPAVVGVISKGAVPGVSQRHNGPVTGARVSTEDAFPSKACARLQSYH